MGFGSPCFISNPVSAFELNKFIHVCMKYLFSALEEGTLHVRNFQDVEYSYDFHKLGSTRPIVNFG